MLELYSKNGKQYPSRQQFPRVPTRAQLRISRSWFFDLKTYKHPFWLNIEKILILRNRLLNVVCGVDECLLAYHKPAETVHRVICDIHSALSTVPKRASVLFITPIAHITGRRYYSAEHRHKSNKEKKCFSCGKPGCCSTKHSSRESIQAILKTRQIRKIVADISADDQNSKSYFKLADALHKVIIHIQDTESNASLVGEEKNSNSTGFSQSPSVFVSHILHCSTVLAVCVCLLCLVCPLTFKRIMADPGVADVSSGNMAQYIAHCLMTSTTLTSDSNRK